MPSYLFASGTWRSFNTSASVPMQDTNTYWYAMSEDTQQPEEQAENTAAPQAESTPDSPETKEPTS